jgi:hypothetical protein
MDCLLFLLAFASLTLSVSACSSSDELAVSAAAPAAEGMAKVRVGRLRIFADAARLFLEAMPGGGKDKTTTGPDHFSTWIEQIHLTLLPPVADEPVTDEEEV